MSAEDNPNPALQRTGALAENWVAVMEQEGVGTYCVDRDLIRWEGSGVSYATQYCTSSHPGLAGSPSGNWVDCAQDLSGDLVYVSDENGQWDRVHASSPSGTAARAVCQGL